jgi:two-component system LytT family sensor kinase
MNRQLLRLLWFAPWLTLALLASVNTLTYWRLSGWDYPAWRAFAYQAPGWLTFGLLTPAILWLGRRFPVERAGLGHKLVVHGAGALVTAVLYACAATAATRLFSPVPTDFTITRIWLNWFLSGLAPSALTYFGVLGVGHAIHYFERFREGELRTALLAGQLSEARLGALRSQLQPHFLFNSLNAITVLVRDGETRTAARMLELLSDVLRRVLKGEAKHEVELREELEVLRSYLAIEQVRFPDRLRVRFDVDDALLTAAVPSFVLQPLVENALRHGIPKSASAGRLDVIARRSDGHLELQVSDDGPGLPPAWSLPDSAGLGLSNTAARIATLYGDGASLSVLSPSSGGTIATIRLPLRWARNG